MNSSFKAGLTAFSFFLISFLSASAQVPEGDLLSTGSKELQVEGIYIDALKARMLDDPKTQESLLRDVIRMKPGEAAPYYDLSLLCIRQQKYDEAEKLIGKAIERNPENIWYQAAYANILELQNRPEAAAEVLSKAAKNEQHNREFLLGAGTLYEAAGKYKEAIGILDMLIKQMGEDESLLLRKQQLYLRLNDLEGAVKLAQKLIDLNPGEGRYYANLAELYSTNGQQEKALEIYEKALKDFPNDPNVAYSLANFYLKKNDIPKYDEYIKKSILNEDLGVEIQANILLSYLQQIASDSSRKHLGVEVTEKLIEEYPDNSGILNLYGEVLLSSGMQEKAIPVFKKSIQEDPSDFMAWQRLLFSYTGPEDADSLVLYSKKALNYFPAQALVHYVQGVGYFYKKNYDQAIKSINRAVDLQPEENRAFLADMHSLLGDVYNAKKEYDLSDKSYEKSLSLNPENATVLNNYAYYLSVRNKKLDKAMEMSEKSLKLRPGEATFLDTYAWILYRKEDYQKAKEYILQAIEKNPDAGGEVWDHLGDIYFRLNDKEKAVESWRKAKEKGTENPNIDKKIQDRKLYE